MRLTLRPAAKVTVPAGSAVLFDPYCFHGELGPGAALPFYSVVLLCHSAVSFYSVILHCR